MTNVPTYYRLANRPSIGQGAVATPPVPVKPLPPPGVPPIAINVAIVVAGLGLGLAAFPYRKKPLGGILVGTGGSMAGLGFVFTILDLLGARSA